MAVRIDLNISLDGYATTTDQTAQNPFGEDWSRLVAAYVATRTMQERVFGDTSGAGTTGVEDWRTRMAACAGRRQTMRSPGWVILRIGS